MRTGACTEKALARALLQQLRMRVAEALEHVDRRAREPRDRGADGLLQPLLDDLLPRGHRCGALLLGVLVGQLVHFAISGEYRIGGLLLVMPAMAFCLTAFWFFGLYDAMAQSVPDELRNMTATMTLMYLCAEAVTLLHGFRGSHVWPLPWIAASWATSIFAVPIARAILRAKCAHRPWWGHPVVVLGAAKTGRLLVRTLRAQPQCGLKPVLMLDDDRSKHGTLRASLNEDVVEVRSTTQASTELLSPSLRAASDALLNDSVRVMSADLVGDLPPKPGLPNSSLRAPAARAEEKARAAMGSSEASERVDSSRPPPASAGNSVPSSHPSAPLSGTERPRGMFAEVEKIPVVGKLELAPVLARRLKIPYAIVAMPGLPSEKLLQLAERVGGVFSHLLIIPDLFGFASLGVPARDVGGILGIEVRQQLLLPWPRFAKRVMDVVLTALGGLCILPVFALLTLLIVLDSKGSPSTFRIGSDETAALPRLQVSNDARGRRSAAQERARLGSQAARGVRGVPQAEPRPARHAGRAGPAQVQPRRAAPAHQRPNGDMSLVGPRPYLEREIPDMEARRR